jgi:tetratricopeptide (TPR) repeat protein
MFRMKQHSRNLVVPAVIAAVVGVTQFLIAQMPEKSLVEASTVTIPEVQPPVRTATPEQTGDSLVARQRYQAAIAAYSRSPEMTAPIWNKMGISYQLMFNSRDAMRCYRESLKLDPHNPQFLNNLGTAFASLKEYGQADRLYRKALKFDPQNAAVLKNLGTNLLAEKKYNKGWEAYQQALAIDPQIFNDRSSPKVENPASVEERGAMNYYMALGCARSGYTDCALQYLRAALNEGFVNRKKVAAEADFASLRTNPAFEQLMAEPTAQ